MDPVTRERLQALYQQALASDSGAGRDHVPPEALLAVVERRGGEDERLRTMDHVMSCPTCRAGFDLLRAVHEARPEPARPAWPAWRSIALAASLLLAVGIATQRWRRPDGATPDIMRGAAALPTGLAPVGRVPADSARTFVWRAVEGAQRYDLALLAADGTLLHGASTTDTTYVLPPTVTLGTGDEYQWLVSATLPTSQRSVAPGVRFTVR